MVGACRIGSCRTTASSAASAPRMCSPPPPSACSPPRATNWKAAAMADTRAGSALAPSTPLHISRTTWPKGLVFHRVHDALYGATEFHPGTSGNARFSPIRNKAGGPIPTLYGGASFECAAMETVFHDIPFTAGFKAYDKAKLD